MSVQQNKARARRVFDEVWSQGKLDLTEELLSPDFVGRPGGFGKPFQGPEGARAFLSRFRSAFPDMAFTVEELVAESDQVAIRWTCTGTHEGDFMGFEPTEREATFEGMTFLRFARDGAIVEGWTQMDAIGLLRAIGALREPARV
jgi:steroid delta-isomerase-like uncharacterized protein